MNVDDKGLALQGYDPVAYINPGKGGERRPQAERHRRRRHLLLFKRCQPARPSRRTPQAYLPAYGGWCAYAMAGGDYVDVNPKTFKLISGTAHLFYNGFLGNTMKKWDKDQAKLKAAADAQWKKLQAAPESK